MIKENLRKNMMTLQVVGLIGAVLVIWLFDPDVKSDLTMTCIIGFLGLSTFFLTYRLFERIKYLEGILTLCRSCKKVHVRNEWVAIDRYLTKHSDVEFAHDYCPDCWARQQQGPLPKAPVRK